MASRLWVNAMLKKQDVPTVDAEFEQYMMPLADAERAELERSLIAEGCRDALVTWKDILLDGHHRLAICLDREIPFRTASLDLSSREAAHEWIARNQLGRRNASPFYRVELALKLEAAIAARAKLKQSQAGKKKLKQNSAEASETREEVARLASVSHDTLAKAKKILACASETVKKRLRQGQTTIHREYHRLIQEERRSAGGAAKTDAEVGLARLLLGSIQDRGREIADASVPLIFTDPPYDEAAVSLYGVLAEFCARVLTPGGMLVCYHGSLASTFFDQTDLMRPHLRPINVGSLWMPGACSRLWGTNVWTRSKPLTFWTRLDCQAKSPIFENGFSSEGYRKDHHKWEQSIGCALYYIGILTNAGDLVCDPFLGGGTTGAAAVSLSRNFVGIEIDPVAMATATARLKGAEASK